MSRERAILDAAAEAFYENGFHGVGVDGIGARAGMSGPSLYRHFSSKDEILATLLNEAMDELMGATAPLHDEPQRDFARAVRHHLDFARSNRHLVNVYQREVRSLVDPWKRPFTRRRRRYTESWEALVARRRPDLDRSTVAAITQACLGSIFSLSYWPRRALTDSDTTGLVLALVEQGVAGVSPPPRA